MSFYAANFIYDTTISSEYGLRITSDESGEGLVSGADVELYTQAIYRRPKPYLLGVQQSPALTIPIRITTPNDLAATEASVISNWLFGQMNYKKLTILQPDMQYIYFNCIFINPQVIRVGNTIRGFVANIMCDSPFSWEYPQTISYSYGAGGFVQDNIIINNTSDNVDYTYPTVVFKMNVFGGNLSIINYSDSIIRAFTFTGLSANEEITVNNDLQIITSSLTEENRLTNFSNTSGSANYKWLRFIPKKNNLTITGDISTVEFTYQNARKIS